MHIKQDKDTPSKNTKKSSIDIEHYDLKRFAKCSLQEQKAEYERISEYNYDDPKSLDEWVDLLADMEMIMDGQADLVPRSGVKQKPLKGGPVEEGFTMGTLSYIRGGLKQVEKGTSSLRGRGVIFKLLFLFLIMAINAIFQIGFSLHWHVLDWKALWPFLPFFDPNHLAVLNISTILECIIVLASFLCIFISAVTWSLRWLIPLVSICTAALSGMLLGSRLALFFAWAYEPNGLWYEADGSILKLDAYTADWHNAWPSWLFALIVLTIGLLLSVRAFRKRSSRTIRPLNGSVGSIALIILLYVRNQGVSVGVAMMAALLWSVFWLPGEFGSVGKIEEDGTDPSYEWDAALYIWYDFVLIFGTYIV